MPAAAEADGRAAGKVEHPAFRINDFEIALNPYRAVVADRNFCCCQSFLLNQEVNIIAALSSAPECAGKGARATADCLTVICKPS